MNEEERLNRLIEVWNLIVKPGRRWVLFEKGTCYVVADPEMDIETHAKEVLKEWGPVVPGTPLGDFSVSLYYDDDNHMLGWLVSYGHPDILSFVLVDEVEDLYEFIGKDDVTKEKAAETYPHMVLGMYARNRREEDGKELKIVYSGSKPS